MDRTRVGKTRVHDANSQPTLSSPLDTTTATRPESAPPTVLFFFYFHILYIPLCFSYPRNLRGKREMGNKVKGRDLLAGSGPTYYGGVVRYLTLRVESALRFRIIRLFSEECKASRVRLVNVMSPNNSSTVATLQGLGDPFSASPHIEDG